MTRRKPETQLLYKHLNSTYFNVHFCCIDFRKFIRQGPHEVALWWASAGLKRSNSNLRTCWGTALSMAHVDSIREPQPKPNDDFNKGAMLNSLIVNLAEEDVIVISGTIIAHGTQHGSFREDPGSLTFLAAERRKCSSCLHAGVKRRG